MKYINTRTFHGYALALLVFLYGFAIFRLFDTGWYLNASAATRIVTGALIGVAAMILWNLVVHFFKSKKETTK